MSVVEKIVSIMAPHSCFVCGFEGLSLCRSCEHDAPQPLPSRCFRCFRRTESYKTCSTCRRVAPLTSVWVTSEYEGTMQALIHELKFTRNRHMAKPLARLLAEQMPYFTEAPIITHIPTATSRRRMRGYDQAELLAVELARLTGYRHVGLLRREGQQRQVGAHRQTRIEQLRGALRPIRASMINQAEIIIVDDVMTTGATLTAAAETLKDAGAKQLHGLVLAQKS